MKPLVSVCIPMHNGAAHLTECLESGLAQTFADVEFVLVDDGSTDDTVTVAEEFVRRDSRVRLYRNLKNIGLVANWCKAVELAKGDWIKFLFQDDFLEPNCVQRMLEARSQGALLIVCQRALQFESGTPENVRATYTAHFSEHNLARAFPNQTSISAARFAELLLLQPIFNWIGEPTAVMLHRSAFERFGQFNSNLVMFCDWEFFARVAAQTGIRFIPESLGTFRVHGRSVSATNRNRYYRAEILDPLIIQHELAYQPVFEPARLAAERSKPRINLEHRFIASARAAHALAIQLANDPAQPDPQPLNDWQTILSHYPRMESLPASYIFAGALRRAKSITADLFTPSNKHQ
jgi:glycosyltransferase involved in cell wall biosynthesis